MHKIFVSEAIVLGKRAAGEANTRVALLTRELGLLRASARSARLEKSKLRYGLEPLTRGRFSLVRGRNEWKLTGAEHLTKLAGAHRARVGKVSHLLLRLIHGEEPVVELFDTVSEGLRALARAQDTDAELLECVLVLRMLARLGYLPQRPELAPFLSADFFSLELSAEMRRSRATLVRAINESLSATGL